jgi:four helix bundle protein
VNSNAAAKSFRELRVYQAARDAALRVFIVTKTFPREERYALIDQVRRSSRAVKAMIAEAWARRRYKAAFVNKIDEALGEANESNRGWTTLSMTNISQEKTSGSWTVTIRRLAECFRE